MRAKTVELEGESTFSVTGAVGVIGLHLPQELVSLT